MGDYIMIKLVAGRKIVSKSVIVLFVVILMVIPGYVFAGTPGTLAIGTPHRPAFVQNLEELVDVEVEHRSVPSHPVSPSTTDVNITELVQQLNEALISSYLENLTAFGPRETGTESCNQAAQYLYNTFTNIGLEVRYHNYTDDAVSGSNVEATLLGADPTNIFIICGHYDSVPDGPGADDDGSGVAVVLAAAELMSKYEFGHTVRFVAFSGEEQGLIGSRHYAEDAYNNNESIVAVLNADMIGYTAIGSDGKQGKIFENPASEWIVEFTQDISVLYTDYIDIQLIPQGETWGSDHYYFWEYGYDAVFYHEFHFNDYYHSANDTIAHMNLTYSTRFSRLILATLATMALPPRPVLKIADIVGGLGISTQITNIGDSDAIDMNATIGITGGLFGFIDISETSGVPLLVTQGTMPLKAKFFRLGPITITVVAEASNTDQVSKQATGFVIGPFVMRVTNLP
jgi:aminopeptidase YwaD